MNILSRIDRITESKIVYENPKGDVAKVEGLYAEINNKYDKEFKNKKELDNWLKKEKYEWVGG